MTKYVKLYEQFQNDEILNELKMDFIFENILYNLRKKGISIRTINSKVNEEEEYQDEFTKWLYTDEPLNAAELRAQAQNKQVLNKRQMAVMYLAALGDYEYKDITEYIKVIPGLQDYNFTNMSKSDIIPILCEVFDVDSVRTFNLTQGKFKNHISGKVEDPEELAKNVDYEKLREIYYILNEKATKDGPNDIAAALADAVGLADNLQSRLDDLEIEKEAQNARNRERNTRIKEEDAIIGEDVFNMVKQLVKSTIPVKSYSKMIYDRMPKYKPNRVYDAYIAYLRRSGESLEFFPLNRPI